MKQDYTLELADKLSSLCVAAFAWVTLDDAAAELRRLYARNKELEVLLDSCTNSCHQKNSYRNACGSSSNDAEGG